MKLMKKLRKRWLLYQFRKRHPIVSERRKLLNEAVVQGRLQRLKENG